LKEQAVYLDSARPTAVNLSWSLKRMLRAADRAPVTDTLALYRAFGDEPTRIHREDEALCEGIGQHGLPLITAGCGVLAHCKAGSLARVVLGRAVAPAGTAHREGIAFRGYADETLPLVQGARLTAYELLEAGIDIALSTDRMVLAPMPHRLSGVQ